MTVKSLWTMAAGLSLLIVFSGTSAAAELYRRVAFMVRPEAVVRGEEIYLRDIATFSATEKEFDGLLQSLKNLKLGDAPAPKTKVTLLGATVLELIEQAGLPKESIGYSIPKTIIVERDGRAVTHEEVLAEVRNQIWKRKTTDIQVQDVEWANDEVIPVGNTTVAIEMLGDPVAGKIPIRAEITVDDKHVARFLATAIADDWREVPVLTRDVERGAMINPEDIQLVRVNLAKRPTDTVSNPHDLYGMRAKAKIAAGDAIRKSNVDIPPTIPKGKRVVIMYNHGLLRATATGIALEDGFEGSKISLRNESSKKIISGKIKNAEEVEACN